MTDRYALDYAARPLMARIKDSTVEAVRQSADFVAIVEERTPLRKSGGRLVGRCPFHEERTPSFSVNPLDKLYYCLGCHKGGDMIGFVRETQGLDFVGAIEWLAEPLRDHGSSTRRRSPAEDARRRRRERLLRGARGRRVLLRALPLGVARPARSRATTSPGAACARRSAASSGSVSPSAARR